MAILPHVRWCPKTFDLSFFRLWSATTRRCKKTTSSLILITTPLLFDLFPIASYDPKTAKHRFQGGTSMNYRVLGRTGLKVSELCLGTMTFSENFFNIAVVDQLGANTMVARALDAGINFFDTADVYSYGRSEEVLGAALK